MGFEDVLERKMFGMPNEKTFIDKLLGKDTDNEIRKIIKKNRLTREEMLDVLYLISSTETKLLNYSEKERYVMTKFYVWLREFVSVIELYYDSMDTYNNKQNRCVSCKCYNAAYVKNSNKDLKECKCADFKAEYVMAGRTKHLIDDIGRLLEHNTKFLVDFYLNIGRSSLSLGATGFMELLKNKFEVNYDTKVSNLNKGENHGQ